MVLPSTPGLPWLERTRCHACSRFSRSHTSSIRDSPVTGFSGPRFAVGDSVPSRSASGVSPRPSVMKASGSCSYWIFGRLSPMSREAYWPLQSFGPSAARSRSCEPWPFLPFRASVPLERTDGFGLLCPLLTPAPGSGSLTAPSVLPRRTPVRDRAQASRGKFDRLRRTPAGSTSQALDGYGLRGESSARPAWAASYPVSVRQVAVWLHASFRRHLATTPLRFASTSPPSGCAGDLHPQAVEHARHTTDQVLHLGRRNPCGRDVAPSEQVVREPRL